jgi:hypothetical protein
LQLVSLRILTLIRVNPTTEITYLEVAHHADKLIKPEQRGRKKMQPFISIIIIFARGIERYEQVRSIKEAALKCQQLGGLQWKMI